MHKTQHPCETFNSGIIRLSSFCLWPFCGLKPVCRFWMPCGPENHVIFFFLVLDLFVKVFFIFKPLKVIRQCVNHSHIYLSRSKWLAGVRQIYESDFHAATRCSQKSSQRLLKILQRRAIILFAPLTVQCMPDCFRRCPTTVRHPASKTPEPTKRPLFLKSACRIRSLFFQNNRSPVHTSLDRIPGRMCNA